jgi:hypothetical protein
VDRTQVFSSLPVSAPRCLEKVLHLRRTSDGFPVREGATRQGKAQERTFRFPLPASRSPLPALYEES